MARVYVFDEKPVSKPDDTDAAALPEKALEERGYTPILYNAPAIRVYMSMQQEEWRYAATLPGMLVFFRNTDDIDSFLARYLMNMPGFRRFLPGE